MGTRDRYFRDIETPDVYLNDSKYYIFHAATAERGPWIESECCGDDIDEAAAIAIVDSLSAWLNDRFNSKPPELPTKVEPF